MSIFKGMTVKEIQQSMIDYVKNSLYDSDLGIQQEIDNNHTADYIGITHSNFILQGYEYHDFMVIVDNYYNKDNFCYDDCILLALHPYMNIIDYVED